MVMHLDVKLSEDLYLQFNNYVELNDRYNNVWRMYKEVDSTWEILFCFIAYPLYPDVFYRHVGFVVGDKFIDPTGIHPVVETQKINLDDLEACEIIPIERLSLTAYENCIAAMPIPFPRIHFPQELDIEISMSKVHKIVFGF